MKYISTRNSQIRVSGAQAIAQGISEDSGLFVPLSFPVISTVELASYVDLSYIERAAEIIGYFLPEFSKQEIDSAVVEAYGTGFDHPKVAPVKKLSDSEYMLELWHGPTSAFKDMALQLLPHLMTLSMDKVGEGREAVILVATSGDTGKAALEGFRDVKGTRMAVFYPEGGVSRIQELQMTTQVGENLEVYAVRGNFDDTQTTVKEIFTDAALAEELAEHNMLFSSANSINWGRLMPQIVYYFSAYCDLVDAGEITLGDTVNVCVPTGNFGNILAAFYAKQMGLPLGKFICASNENNVLTDFFRTGTYDANREFRLTNSPSMDILISSNLERLLFELSDRDAQMVTEHMEKLSATGTYTISEDKKDKLTHEFYGGYLTEEKTKQTIGDVFSSHKYLCDTHTAVAVGVYRDYVKDTGDTTKTIISSTANPYKFADSIYQALSDETLPSDPFETLEKIHTLTGLSIPKQISQLKEETVRFDTVIDREEMKKTVQQMLGL